MMKEAWFGDAPELIIKTPATSANMGPGFDCLGMAVNLHNELWLKILSEGAESVITVEGYGAGVSDNLNNVIYKTYVDALERHGLEVKPVAMHCIVSLLHVAWALALQQRSVAWQWRRLSVAIILQRMI